MNQFPQSIWVYHCAIKAGIFDTGGKFATGVNNTSGNGGKICRRCRWYRCRWHRWCTLTCEYLREFSKKFEMNLMLFSGAWGKVIHEKNRKQKISWHCPFNLRISQCCRATLPTPCTCCPGPVAGFFFSTPFSSLFSVRSFCNLCFENC